MNMVPRSPVLYRIRDGYGRCSLCNLAIGSDRTCHFHLSSEKEEQTVWRISFLCPVKSRYSKRIFQLGLPVALLNSLFAIINLIMARTASTYGGHIGLMTMTAGGQIEAIAWNTSQGFSTALSTFVAQNFCRTEKRTCSGCLSYDSKNDSYVRCLLHTAFRVLR